MSAPTFAVIVPVYNRRDEVRDLLESLSRQTCTDFEAVIVEDGSTLPCRDIVEQYPFARYFFKENEGRSIARNYGMERTEAPWLVFFDSDCVIPDDYFEKILKEVARGGFDCYGGPDAAHESFTPVQKAINFSMTSFLTTGGIRGGRRSLEKFVPRTFNTGFRHKVFDVVGGFREMFSEDIDMSTRIRRAGFDVTLLPDLYVWHKRRVSLAKFFRQVHVFGMSRITLKQLYPGSLKAVHTLPALAVLIAVALILLGIYLSPWWLLPLGVYAAAIFVAALARTRSLKVAAIAVPASAIQVTGYGTGFLRAWFRHAVLGRGRDINREIEMRRGK